MIATSLQQRRGLPDPQHPATRPVGEVPRLRGAAPRPTAAQTGGRLFAPDGRALGPDQAAVPARELTQRRSSSR